MPSNTKRNSKNHNPFLPRSQSSVHPSNYHPNINHTPITQTRSLSDSRYPSETFSTNTNSFSDGHQPPPSSMRNINPYTTSPLPQTPERTHSSHDPNARRMTTTRASYIPPTPSHPRPHSHHQYSSDSSISSPNTPSTYHEIDSSPRQRNERVLLHRPGRAGSHTSDVSIGSISSIDSVRSMARPGKMNWATAGDHIYQFGPFISARPCMDSTRTTASAVDTRPLPSTETKYWDLGAKASPGWERY